ncbi:TPA: o-succinylbenzoate--CoA ligase [Yersinia enterocolitica]|uniref:2-succinylbenzoate--CoA ligase n=1 Tax=Yersinia enterocolitica W22703 TaxID=913028 RepID=F4N775_YEREN|nr:o-succinylbenzoate--CoA ligase [Yersinia enterocolitica]CBX73933.1 2-succinylbenzoate--CoA ligase [Yersinia enterocolitica W22703]ADZ43233.1 O-succinylbenzoic acid--CoA ligase [Yersinia enterocolitica subsp. palearctica 105.5R(r)]AJJ29662.1 O-succinylbenzoate-CoA ligase [Yersinia enterocolitica]ALG79332.1 O-succinylbenzoic acid--CoA ligase [Yersinia enterocolitica]KGA72383.1 O-succinylbenzoate-CoA ligase [Yersinia enterocolitica]
MAQLNNWPWKDIFPWQHWANLQPRATAIRSGAQRISWQQLATDIDNLAAGFQQQGVTPGCGVVLRGKNSYSLLLAYLAALQCAARVLPLNPQLPESLLTQLLPQLDIDFMLNLAEPLPAALSFIPLDITTDNGAPHGVSWDSQRLATMTLTSGSSGLPKAAVHTLAAHLASADGVLRLMDFTANDCWLLSLPLFHVSGQGIVWRWLSAGAALAVQAGVSLSDALVGCSHASLVPTQLWRLLESSGQLLSLKEVLLGGATIPTALTEQAAARGILCWCGYGLTESASTVCAKRADGLPGVGVALEGRQVKLVEGEVWVKAACLAAGYWQQRQLQPLTDSDGWFHTRDRGEWQQGELRILGRLDNLFFSGGEGIQPEDIERVLLQYPGVQQAFVIPVADTEFGHRPVAVIDADEAVDATDLAHWLAPQLAVFQRPVAFYRLPAELKTGGIKVSRRGVFDFVDKLSW